ncbi:MAG: thiamine pyrophosphate-dependent enzyme [Acidobacteriota bacterium]
MNRMEAIRYILARHPGAAVIFCNGLNSREASHLAHRPGNFYLLHGMGEALSVGLGLRQSRPDLEVVVVDGDGNAAMGLGAWTSLPCDGVHYYVLKNSCYETTGGQAVPDLPFSHDAVQVMVVDPGITGTPNPPPAAQIKLEFQQWLADRGRQEKGINE